MSATLLMIFIFTFSDFHLIELEMISQEKKTFQTEKNIRIFGGFIKQRLSSALKRARPLVGLGNWTLNVNLPEKRLMKSNVPLMTRGKETGMLIGHFWSFNLLVDKTDNEHLHKRVKKKLIEPLWSVARNITQEQFGLSLPSFNNSWLQRVEQIH